MRHHRIVPTYSDAWYQARSEDPSSSKALFKRVFQPKPVVALVPTVASVQEPWWVRLIALLYRSLRVW